jgi:hypothetical protein
MDLQAPCPTQSSIGVPASEPATQDLRWRQRAAETAHREHCSPASTAEVLRWIHENGAPSRWRLGTHSAAVLIAFATLNEVRQTRSTAVA